MKTIPTPHKPNQPGLGTAGRTLSWLALLLLLIIATPAWAAEATEEAAAEKETTGEAKAEEEEAKEPLTPEQLFEGGENTFANWIELSAGGMITRGDTAQAQERHRLSEGAFGGIEDLHYQGNIFTNILVTVDGRALFDEHDYKLTLGFEREEKWFVRFHFENFRNWDQGAGGYYVPEGVSYPSLDDDTLWLDRGEFSVEAGLTLEKWPDLRFRYTHRYRDGEKGSTSWGQVHPSGANPILVRGLSPSFYDLDERVDIFELDLTHRIKATDVGLGLRYETADLDNARKITEYQGEPVQRRITDRQGTTHDLFSVHAFTETWIKKNLFFSSGFLYANLDSDFSGSRIYGDDFDVGYVPGYPLGYADLHGGARKDEYVLNLNLMAQPAKHLTLVPSLRVLMEDWDADSAGTGTQGGAAALFSGRNERELLDVRERLEARYTGITNWVLHAGAEWTQGDGNLEEHGGLSRVGNAGVDPIDRDTDDSRFFQKYSAGARWYPARSVTVDLGGYYKLNEYEYDHKVDSTLNTAASVNRYPAYLLMHGFETYDGNIRLTLRPHRTVSLVSRYEYQLSNVRTEPDPVSGLAEKESAEITSHIFAQNVSWTPWSRLYFQAGFNYVWSETQTPTSDFTKAILDAQNNYWTLNLNSGFVVDDQTDLSVGYFYYCADNFSDNSAEGLPLGMSAEEHGITATVTRRISENLRLKLRYGYFDYDEDTFGSTRDYQAHVIFSSLQYRF